MANYGIDLTLMYLAIAGIDLTLMSLAIDRIDLTLMSLTIDRIGLTLISLANNVFRFDHLDLHSTALISYWQFKEIQLSPIEKNNDSFVSTL